jgi:transposase
LDRAALVVRCARLRVDTTQIADPAAAAKIALRRLARRVQMLDAELAETDEQITDLVGKTAPATSAIYGVGPQIAAQLLTTAGENPQRIRSEAALARLCGVAPIPASSGNTTRHRLHRGGDRQANSAIYLICRRSLSSGAQKSRPEYSGAATCRAWGPGGGRNGRERVLATRGSD